MVASLVIGVDLDNTLVSYDEVMYRVALQRGLIPEGLKKSKQAIRDAIRRSQAGDRAWHGVQAAAYGERMEEAQLIDGVAAFFARCRRMGAKVYIVSHKTEWPGGDVRPVHLREAATAWMRHHRFFENDGMGLSDRDVYFEPAREKKLARIGRLGCTHFIDDLVETFLEPSFPDGVRKLLYAPHGASMIPDVRTFTTWKEISDFFFDSGS